ncbi:MAG: SHOCT domain-containing protein [Nitrososphaeria archaeon]
MSDYVDNQKMSSINTELLVAYIFAILVVVAWIIGFLVFFIYYFVVLGLLGGLGPYLAGWYIGIGLTYGVVLLILMIPSILVMRRIGRMRKAAKNNDVSRLKELNSIGWAIVALIFTGIIPGVMLLIAHGPIDELVAEGGLSENNIDKIIKLKTLMDSGVISKEDFEAQKNKLLHGVSSSYSTEEKLKNLKSLLDSGAITQEEYEKQKDAVLKKL